MTTQQIVFYLFAFLSIFSALMVVTTKNPVKAALYLVATFFSSAVIWMLLEAEFLAITLVLVYVGAVMVLFLFVVMMLDIQIAMSRKQFIRYAPVGVLLAGLFIYVIYQFVGPHNFGLNQVNQPLTHPGDYSNVKELALLLYDNYLLPFELAGMLLLVAIIAAISLSFRGRQGSKGQFVKDQVRVKKQDRLKIVKLDEN